MIPKNAVPLATSLMLAAIIALASHQRILAAEGAPTELQGESRLAESRLAESRAEEQAFKAAIALAGPSVVRIETVGGLDQIDDLLLGTGPTTGLIVGADGDIVSSLFNFIAKPSSIIVTLADGRKFPARLIASDHVRMLALLKIDATGLPLPTVAALSSVRVGQWALALGRTYSVDSPSISVGVVSATRRIWGKAIQTDAKVSPVNYGGPLVDRAGAVMGVLVPLSPQGKEESAGVEWYDSGIGFAIPLEEILPNLGRMKSEGDLWPGLMGITFAKASVPGALPRVERVRRGAPAEMAGVKTGDIVVAAGGQSVKTVSGFRQVTGRLYAGDTLDLVVRRDGSDIPISVSLIRKLVPYQLPFLGLRAAAGENGVTAAWVVPGGAADTAGVRSGDTIESLGGQPVTSPSILRGIVSRLRVGEKLPLVVRRSREAEPKTFEAITQTTPEVIPVAVPNRPQPESAEPLPRRGYWSERLPGFDNDYWAYVPESAVAGKPLGLVVWIHPPGATLEAQLLKAWQPVCDQRGLIVIAPKLEGQGAWSRAESEFVRGLIAQFGERYPIAPHRSAVLAIDGSTPFAWTFATSEREKIAGLAVIGGSIPQQLKIDEVDPAVPQQFVVVGDPNTPAGEQGRAIVSGLRTVFHPAYFWDHPGTSEAAVLDLAPKFGAWIDWLDTF